MRAPLHVLLMRDQADALRKRTAAPFPCALYIILDMWRICCAVRIYMILLRGQVDAFRKDCLINGLDDIGLTLKKEAAITR